jgi:hypothetical protein
MSEIRIEIDEDVLGLLGDSTEQIERHALEMIVLELLGMDKLSFIRWSGSLGTPYFDLSAEELREELEILGSS